jgi:hypothetical protein
MVMFRSKSTGRPGMTGFWMRPRGRPSDIEIGASMNRHSDRSQEPLADEERILIGPETWDWENAVEGTRVGEVGAGLPIRFTRDETARLQRAARAAGMTIHAFIKQTALARLPHDVSS